MDTLTNVENINTMWVIKNLKNSNSCKDNIAIDELVNSFVKDPTSSSIYQTYVSKKINIDIDRIVSVTLERSSGSGGFSFSVFVGQNETATLFAAYKQDSSGKIKLLKVTDSFMSALAALVSAVNKKARKKENKRYKIRELVQYKHENATEETQKAGVFVASLLNEDPCQVPFKANKELSNIRLVSLKNVSDHLWRLMLIKEL